ncbi:hypothetical protein DSL92_06540 [Billgrantia gudaonensis]|uniref:Uncharacterized protein n=1 Tax=Billgrantia gudaonensis TaxID=376427 RepID=A0A3S0VSM6_9GAMM|nr:hypothetical protein DSL92_06540 [Halomonas gudaonensis]
MTIRNLLIALLTLCGCWILVGSLEVREIRAKRDAAQSGYNQPSHSRLVPARQRHHTWSAASPPQSSNRRANPRHALRNGPANGATATNPWALSSCSPACPYR